MEVPTEPGYALAVVASKVFSRQEIRGFLSGQGSTAFGSKRHVQIIDSPVPQGRRGGGGGLQDFLTEQSSTATHSSEERISERNVEQIVDSRVLGGGLQDFRPVQGSAASSSSSPDHAGEGFFFGLFPLVFRTFPGRRKSESGSALGVGTECGL